MIGHRSFVISIFNFLFLLYSYKCFEVDILSDVNNNVKGGTCSDVLCSNDKISYLYENSIFLLTELENLLLDLRDEKASHQMEDAYNKQLDYEVAYPESTDYEEISYIDLHNDLYKDSHKGRNEHSNIHFDSDYDYEIDSNMSQPVPFINIYISDDDVDSEEEYNSSNKINEMDNDIYRPLTDGEEIDILLSQLHELEQKKEEKEKEKKKEKEKEKETIKTNYIKRYFR